MKGEIHPVNSDAFAYGYDVLARLGACAGIFACCKPRFESRIRPHLRKSFLNDNEREYVKGIFTAVKKEAEKESGEFATKLELLWYRNNGFLEKRVEDACEFEKR